MDKKILIMGVIALAILMTGCIDEKPDGGVTPSNVTQPAEPVVKNSEEAIDLVKEKNPELGDVEECRFLGDVCNHSIIVNEIPEGWNLTFWKKSKNCEDQCWVKHHFPFNVYENGSLVKGEEHKELELTWGFDSEVEIDVEENESFLIREGQIVKGKIIDYNATIKYLKLGSDHFLKVEDFTYKGELKIFNVTFDCSVGVCRRTITLPISCIDIDFCEVVKVEVKPITWAVDNLEVISLHNTSDAPAIYIKAYEMKEWHPIIPRPISFTINAGETRNESIYSVAKSVHELENRTLHNITVNYISASPKQVFEVIFDGEIERFEVDVDAEILSINGFEKGETCRESKGYVGGKACGHSWQKDNFTFGVAPISMVYNKLYPYYPNRTTEYVSSSRTWNTTKLQFRIRYGEL